MAISLVDAQMNNGKPVEQVPKEMQSVDSEKCKEWAMILKKYKSGKSLLEDRMKKNQQYWRGLHWREIRERIPDAVEPTSAWLTNVVLAKHAARMDAYPEALVLAREMNDEAEAQCITSILPCILEMTDFKKAYSQVGWDKEISCSGAYCITWDASKHNGLGDIDISAVDIMNLYWEPGITDIQQSKYVFAVKLVDYDVLKEQYPNIDIGKGGGKLIEPTKYVYEDNVDTTDKECVIDVYYKKHVNGKTVLHYAKFVRDILLYSTENETQPITDMMGNATGPSMAERGLYDHGLYPFVFENVYPVKGGLCGFGIVDICRNPQDMIDVMGSAIVKNCIENATPRYFVRSDAQVNLDQFSNMNERIINVNGNLNEDSIKPLEQTALQGNILNFYQYKIDEMKQTAGNRDASNGGTEGGITAASALAILQESGNALSRDENGVAYDAFKEICKVVIELIRQFYDLPRFFRIAGERGAVEYITYTNQKIKEQMEFGMQGEMVYRKPEFDLDINASASSDYTAQAMNNLALQFYQAGFFNPMNAIMALQCLDMMEFKGKDKMYKTIQESAMIYQQQMAAQSMAGGNTEADVNGNDNSTKEAAQERADKKQAEAKKASVDGAQPK